MVRSIRRAGLAWIVLMMVSLPSRRGRAGEAPPDGEMYSSGPVVTRVEVRPYAGVLKGLRKEGRPSLGSPGPM